MQENLARGLSIVSRAVSTRSTLPRGIGLGLLRLGFRHVVLALPGWLVGLSRAGVR